MAYEIAADPMWQSSHKSVPPSAWEVGQWYGTVDELDHIYEVFQLDSLPDSHGHARVTWSNGSAGVRNMDYFANNCIVLPIKGMDERGYAIMEDDS